MSTRQMTIAVEGMTCGHCEQSVQKGVSAIPGVHEVTADRTRNEVRITLDEGVDPDEVRKVITDLGYQPVG